MVECIDATKKPCLLVPAPCEQGRPTSVTSQEVTSMRSFGSALVGLVLLQAGGLLEASCPGQNLLPNPRNPAERGPARPPAEALLRPS